MSMTATEVEPSIAPLWLPDEGTGRFESAAVRLWRLADGTVGMILDGTHYTCTRKTAAKPTRTFAEWWNTVKDSLWWARKPYDPKAAYKAAEAGWDARGVTIGS